MHIYSRRDRDPRARARRPWFTGTVRIDPLFNTFDPARVQGAQ